MVTLQGKLFGTNGVRFIPGVDADLGFVIKLAECIGTYFSEGELLIGRDVRNSGAALSSAVTGGLMSSGRSVAEAGMVPTPALEYTTRALGFRGGIMITASHNPPEYNGVKVIGPEGVEITRLDEQKIEKIFHDESIRRARWNEVGSLREEPSAIQTYFDGVVSKVDAKLIASRRLSVVMDPGNGAQCLAAPFLLDRLGCKVITINAITDGGFPGRGPEPTPEKLTALGAVVRAAGADLGVAYDGDGDRSLFCDEHGTVYWGDQTGSLLADYLLERSPGSTLVTPVSSSQVVEMVAERRKGKVIRTRVGSVDVSRTILERGAFLGFEENGGFIYPAHLAVRDGGMTTALMLECIASRGLSFSKIMANAIPRFFQSKTKLQVSADKVRETLRKVERQADGRVEKTDGIKLWTDEKSWVLVRPSGTEPIIRIFAESDSEEKVESLVRKFTKIVKEA